MGSSKLFKTTFHPNKIRREAEHKAHALMNNASQSCKQQQAELMAQKDKYLVELATVCTDAKTQLNSWYQEELAATDEDYNQKHNEYTAALNEANQAKIKLEQEIEVGFNAGKQQLIDDFNNNHQTIQTCKQQVISLTKNTKNYYVNYKLTLERLWDQITSNMLHKRCLAAYQQLKQPTISSNPLHYKNYSLLVGYLQQLLVENLICESIFDKYKKFLFVLCNNNVIDIEKDSNFITIDQEITELLASIAQQDHKILDNAYNKDSKQYNKSYNLAIEFDKALQLKVNAVEKDINIKYEQAVAALNEEKKQKFLTLNNNFATMVEEIESSWQNYKIRHATYINDINNKRDTKLNHINEHEEQNKIKIEQKCQEEIIAIQQAFNKHAQEINSALDEQLKKLKHSRISNLLNASIATLSGVAAYFTGGLSATIGAHITESIQASLLATSLGSLERLLNGKDKIGVNLSGKLIGPEAVKNVNFEIRNNNQDLNNTQKEQLINLSLLQAKIEQFSQSAQSWQLRTEQNLFYQLNRSVSPIKLNFSEALSLYSKKSTNNLSALNGRFQLGPLETNGYRALNWNISANGLPSYYGTEMIQDFYLRRVCDIVKNSNKKNNGALIPNNWHKAQEFKFNNLAANTLKAILDFSATMLFGSQAHATEKSLFNDNKELTLAPMYSANMGTNSLDELHRGIKISDNGMSCYKVEETSPLPFFPPAIVKSQSEQKRISYMFDKLRDKFKSTDWRPLRSSSNVKTHTVRIEKDKQGNNRYRDDKGRFSKSALDKAKESLKTGEINSSQIEGSINRTLFNSAGCKVLDFGRINTSGIETGGRIYGCNDISANLSLNEEGLNLAGAIGGGAGINLASAEATSSIGTSRLDVNGPNVSSQAEINLKINKEETDVNVAFGFNTSLLEVKGRFQSEPICIKDICCNAEINTSVGVTCAANIAIGYKNYNSKHSKVVTAGLGLGPLVGRITVDCFSKNENLEFFEEQDNNTNNNPKLSL
jgi:hypothetical protein